jgi:hypothetical protein
MSAFLDIAEARETITVGNQSFEVRAVTLGDLADLALRFEPVKQLLDGKGFKSASLIEMGRPAVSAVIAAGVGHCGEPEYEAKANRLSGGDQLKILRKLYELSFPSEVRGPLEQMLGDLFNTNRVPAAADQPPASSDSTGKPSKS